MKSKFFMMVSLVMLLMLASGCNGKAAPPNIDAQKKVINTYMEGLRDSDKDKIINTANPDVALQYELNPDSLDKIISFQKKIGPVKEWKVIGEPYVDDVNNQSLIDVKAIYPKTQYILHFDLRRFGSQWTVYTIENESSSSNLKSNK